MEKNRLYRLGFIVLIILGVLTLLEFALSQLNVSVVWVFMLIALVKAFLVLRDYMHIGKLFKEEE
jgi:heme/copper-type cytochrome/quinol oxidase subunit 4